jgi:hypothetical protein
MPSYDIVGAAISAAEQHAGGPLAVERLPSNLSVRPMGFIARAIAAGATAVITQTVQDTGFRIEQLLVQGSDADDLTLESLMIGNKPQFSASGPIPASSLSQLAREVKLKIDTANAGQTITMNVKNNHASAVKSFLCTAIGTALT